MICCAPSVFVLWLSYGRLQTQCAWLWLLTSLLDSCMQPECLLPTSVMELAFVKPMPNMDTLLNMTLPATAVLHSPHERTAAAAFKVDLKIL